MNKSKSQHPTPKAGYLRGRFSLDAIYLLSAGQTMRAIAGRRANVKIEF